MTGRRLRRRHLVGAGAGACAVCCAPPVLALVGIAGTGAAATAATAAFSGLVFALVVAGATVLALLRARRRGRSRPASGGARPVPVALGLPPRHE